MSKSTLALFHLDTDEARRLTGRIPELRRQVEAETTARAGWSVEEQKRRPKSAELLEYEKFRAEQRQQWQQALILSASTGERTEVRCRNPLHQLSTTNHQLPGSITKFFQDAVNF